MTDHPIEQRLLGAIAEREVDAKDAKLRLNQRVAFALGKSRGETEVSMAGGHLWKKLTIEARDVIHCDIDGDPHDEILRLCQAQRDIVNEYLWARQKAFDAHHSGAPHHHVDREQAAVKAMSRTLTILDGCYGIEEAG